MPCAFENYVFIEHENNLTSITESKKRKFSMENASGLDVTLTDDTLNRSQMTPTSPWEVRRLKADLIDNDTKVSQCIINIFENIILDKLTNNKFLFLLTTQIAHLKKELESRATAHANMESVYMVKVKGLENQLEKKTEKVSDLEKHLKFVRKREGTLNAELSKLRTQYLLDKQNQNDEMQDLQKVNRSLESKCRKIECELGSTIANLQRQLNDLEKVQCSNLRLRPQLTIFFFCFHRNMRLH